MLQCMFSDLTSCESSLCFFCGSWHSYGLLRALTVNLRCSENTLPTASIAVKTQEDSFGASNSETIWRGSMQSCAKNNHGSVPLSLTGIFASLLHNLSCLSLNISQLERDAEIFFGSILLQFHSHAFQRTGIKEGSTGCVVFPNLRELCEASTFS